MSDIPTQHVLLKNIRKIRDNIEKKSHGGRRAYDLTLDNIVMKANVKCGGLNYTADPPREYVLRRLLRIHVSLSDLERGKKSQRS